MNKYRITTYKKKTSLFESIIISIWVASFLMLFICALIKGIPFWVGVILFVLLLIWGYFKSFQGDNVFIYNTNKIIVKNLRTKKIRAIDISNVKSIEFIHFRWSSYIVRFELLNGEKTTKSLRIVDSTELKEMVEFVKFVKKVIQKREDQEPLIINKNEGFKCRKIHIEPDNSFYTKVVLCYYGVYILVGFIFWDNIVDKDNYRILGLYFTIFLIIPFILYWKKSKRAAHNVYLNDCVITITNESTGYKKIIPFEAIKNIRYDNGIEIELNIGQKLHYKICGDQSRKRLGIEKIIAEFQRFKNMTVQITEKQTN